MRTEPPAEFQALAENYRCGHCNSDPAKLIQDDRGMWHIGIPHDDGCPVLTGTVSDLPDTFRALKGTP